MSTVIGRRLIDGSGVRYHRGTGNCGTGIVRTVASKAFEMGANAAVQKISNLIKGNGIKITGEGRKRKVGRPTKANATAYKKRH